MRKPILLNIASPYGLAAISCAFFLFACFIPPSLYSHYMAEPDLMFLDPATMLYYLLCVIFFCAGLYLLNWIFPSSFEQFKSSTTIPSILFLLCPLLLGIGALCAADVYLIRHFPTFLALLFSQHGEDIKNTLAMASDADTHLQFIPISVTGLVWWAYWRGSRLDLRRWQWWCVRVFLFLGWLMIISFAVLTLSRALLMLATEGFLILFLVRVASTGRLNVGFLLRIMIAAVLGAALMFLGFAFLRGSTNLDSEIGSLGGYTVASYNRLAAVVNGQLHYPFAGRGIYLSGVAVHSRVLPFNSLLNPPDYLEVWGSEFGAVEHAGLDGSLIWSGAFGYIFSDLGWYSVIWVFGYGILYGLVWKAIKCESIFGAILYPYFGACILFWLGSNYLFEQPLEVLLPLSMLLAGFEFLFLKRIKIINAKI